MPPVLSELFARYGYIVIVAGVLLENAGVPAPGHTVVLAGAFLASRGTLSLAAVIGLSAASAVAGDTIGYWIGRRGGRRLVERHGKLIRLTPQRLASVEAFFAKHGAKAVVIARFATGLQTAGALFAGISGMRWPVFFRFTERVRWLLVPAVSLGALSVFAKIADEVQERETTTLDRAVSLAPPSTGLAADGRGHARIQLPGFIPRRGCRGGRGRDLAPARTRQEKRARAGALIGLSRVFLGVHWITDVLAGWAAGAFIALIATYFMGEEDQRR